MYLFDTDTLIPVIRGTASSWLVARLAGTPLSQQFVSSITIGELWYGAHKLPHLTPHYLGRLENSIVADLAVLPFDREAAIAYGPIRALLEQQGNQIGDADTRIAAIALSRGLTVVTANLRHFSRVPNLRLANWLEA
ncbi:MAG: PIN domain-containing protein [Chloroflexi bacterium]|nr:PIN domain-containing protein [Chloroflexota bacterium]